MLIRIDPQSNQPIYDQIIRQFKFAVATRSVVPGQWVPSVRELATELIVNPNTVARAYRELQGAGVLETVRGQGMRVASRAPRRCLSEQKELIRVRIEQVIREASLSSLSREEMETLVEGELDRFFNCEPSPKGTHR
jgi:GntR family transcriptional regulator